MKTLALMQGAWAIAAYRKPSLVAGNWITYLNGDKPSKDLLWEGRGIVIAPPSGPKDMAVVEWYELDPPTGTYQHAPLPNGQAWHLDPKAIFHLEDGQDLKKPNKVRLSLASDLYMVAGVDKNGHKHKLYLEDILLEREDIRPTERFGPDFIKRNENSHVYKVHIERTLTGNIKVNAWGLQCGPTQNMQGTPKHLCTLQN
jgi:hypothetical protein